MVTPHLFRSTASAPDAGIAWEELPSLNHRIEVLGGVLEDDCRAIIQEFFRGRR